MREKIVFVLFCLILAAAAFGWGMMYENRRYEGLQEKFYKLDRQMTEIAGRLEAIEKPQKAEGKRQKAL